MADLNWINFYNSHPSSIRYEWFFTLFGFDSEGIKYVLDVSCPTSLENPDNIMYCAFPTKLINTKHMAPLLILKYLFRPYFNCGEQIAQYNNEDPDYDPYILFEYFLPPRNYSGIKVSYIAFPRMIKNALKKCGTIEDKKLNQILTNYFLAQWLD